MSMYTNYTVKLKDNDSEKDSNFYNNEINSVFDFVSSNMERELTDDECRVIGLTIRGLNDCLDLRDSN